MITRTFLNKSNTIKKGSNENYGMHPIVMFNSGLEETRVLIHFDIDNIESFLKNKEKASECRHILRMTNCGSIDPKKYGLKVTSNDSNSLKERAVSFDIYAFPIEQEWDEGVGFDSYYDFWLSGRGSISSEASNWNNAKSGSEWEKNGCIGDEINFDSAISHQHFDHGNEDLELDITDYVNDVISGERKNFGLCLVFVQGDDVDKKRYTQYVGFFGPHTNTFFEPVIESRIPDYIRDDRFDFHLGRTNRLYLYCCSDGQFLNLKTNPTCTINNIKYPVKQQDTGIYYAEVALTGTTTTDMIFYDLWSGIELEDGTIIDDIEMEFVTHPTQALFSFGPDMPKETIMEPSLSGINDDETLNVGDIRKVDVKFRFPYSTNYKSVNQSEYRIYSKDADREIEIIGWEGINNAGNVNYFIIKADELVPGNYFVDIRFKTKSQVKTFKECLRFKKVNDITKITH